MITKKNGNKNTLLKFEGLDYQDSRSWTKTPFYLQTIMLGIHWLKFQGVTSRYSTYTRVKVDGMFLWCI